MTEPGGSAPGGSGPEPEAPSNRGTFWRGGPPWRVDGGGFGPWDRRDPRVQGMWRRRARHWQRMEGQGRWHARRGFGCLFGLLFLMVAGSLVAVVATLLSNFGPLPALIVAASVVLVLFGMGRTLFLTARALDRLVEVTRQVESGDYSVRVGMGRRSVGGLRIVRQLTSGFDTMAARLEADEEQRRTLLADVSHELRTPLTVITGNLEAILDGVYPADPAHLTPILDETRVMERLIDDLRTVALLPHVFDRFVKGTGSRGSGLGLAIARGLVEAHGGTISVDSKVGGGTTFRVELPRSTEG